MADRLAKLEKAYRRNPDLPLFARLADLYLDRGMVFRALDLCQKGCARFPDYTTGFLILSKCHEARGEFEAARRAMGRALRLDPENPVGFKRLSRIYQELGNTELALKSLEQAARLDPLDPQVDEQRDQLTYAMRLESVVPAEERFDVLPQEVQERPSAFVLDEAEDEEEGKPEPVVEQGKREEPASAPEEEMPAAPKEAEPLFLEEKVGEEVGFLEEEVEEAEPVAGSGAGTAEPLVLGIDEEPEPVLAAEEAGEEEVDDNQEALDSAPQIGGLGDLFATPFLEEKVGEGGEIALEEEPVQEEGKAAWEEGEAAWEEGEVTPEEEPIQEDRRSLLEEGEAALEEEPIQGADSEVVGESPVEISARIALEELASREELASLEEEVAALGGLMYAGEEAAPAEEDYPVPAAEELSTAAEEDFRAEVASLGAEVFAERPADTDLEEGEGAPVFPAEENGLPEPVSDRQGQEGAPVFPAVDAVLSEPVSDLDAGDVPDESVKGEDLQAVAVSLTGEADEPSPEVPEQAFAPLRRRREGSTSAVSGLGPRDDDELIRLFQEIETQQARKLASPAAGSESGIPSIAAGLTTAEEEDRQIATVTLAEIYTLQGLTQRATDIYRQILDHDPGNAEIRDKLAALERGHKS